MNQKLLHDFIVEEHIKNALKEDIGFGLILQQIFCTKRKIQ